MDDQKLRRGGGYAGPLAAALLAASAFVGWRMFSDRGASTIDTEGFDISKAPKTSLAAAGAAGSSDAPAPPSGLQLLRVDEEIRAKPAGARPETRPAAPAAETAAVPERSLAQSRLAFTAAVRRSEATVRRFGERMSAQSPVLRQYGADWMSRSDLRNLTDAYWRDHDPIAFMTGLARAPSFPLIVKQYAGSSEIRGFIVQGLTKEAPDDLVKTGLDLMRDDASLKGTITQVGTALGLPQNLAASLGARDAPKPTAK
jgi:hypothetical protein